MKVHSTPAIAVAAVSNNASRPAAALVHDHEDGRLIVFRIAPGQQVPVHTSVSSVILTVVSGSGFVSGTEGEAEVRAGDVVTYLSEEPHGMRAGDEQLVLTAVVAPRPASR